jgi:hypothetical protein
MPTKYNHSSPRFFKDNKKTTVLHNHGNVGYINEIVQIKGCIAYFTEILEDKNLDSQSRGAVKCAIAEDQARIELVNNLYAMDRK